MGGVSDIRLSAGYVYGIRFREAGDKSGSLARDLTVVIRLKKIWIQIWKRSENEQQNRAVNR